MDDWLEDPLAVRKKGSLKFKQPNSLEEDARQNWETFHFSTRLKLEAADHFCRLAIGAASMPYDFGLPGLASSQITWYLDAYFFELMSAYDTLLQELNVIYAINRDIGGVNWSAIKDNLPTALLDLMEKERKAEWFKRLRSYRNMATHHMYIPTGATTRLRNDYHELTIWHFDTDTKQWKNENIKDCPDYLKKMKRHIRTVWSKMAEEFD